MAFYVGAASALEEVAWVVSRSYRRAFEFIPSAAHRGDGAGQSEQPFRCGAAEGEDALGFDDGDFCPDEGHADSHFLGRGLAIIGGLVRRGGPEFDDVGNINFLTGNPHRLEDVVELLACRADERFALALFLVAGGLADEHHAGLGISRGEDHRLPQ